MTKSSNSTKRTRSTRKKNSELNVTLQNSDGLIVTVPLNDVINSTYTDISNLKVNQEEMKDHLLSTSKSLGDVNRSIILISEKIDGFNESLSKKLVDIEKSTKNDLMAIEKKIPKKFTTWLYDNATKADALTKVLKVVVIISGLIWTIFAGIPDIIEFFKKII